MDKTKAQIEAEYRSFVADTGGVCWRCGRTARDRPSWWNAPFGIERAHIEGCNHQRRKDRRAVLALCSLCHRVQHRDKFGKEAFLDLVHNYRPFRVLTLPEQLAIKSIVDPDYYDRKFLQTCSIRRLPRAATRKQAEKVSWAVRQTGRTE